MTKLFLFHGGAPGLEDNGLILPPSKTGALSTTLQSTLNGGLTDIAQRPDKVYLTSDVKLARVYAGMWTDPTAKAQRAGGGSIYEVEVEDGSLAPDEDVKSMPGVSFQADSAVIVRVQHKHVPFNKEQFAKKLNDVLRAHARAKGER
jgi:hypothetical protein